MPCQSSYAVFLLFILSKALTSGAGSIMVEMAATLL